MKNPGHETSNLKHCVAEATAGCLSVVELGTMFGYWLAHAGEPDARRIGVDAWEPYLQGAREKYPGMTFLNCDAREFARTMEPVDCVLMVDFLEHLTREDADELVRHCQEKCQRIVLFIPMGNHPQDSDVTGYGAHELQTHRSTWYAEDLPGFDVAVWPKFHRQEGKDRGAMFAVWNK